MIQLCGSVLAILFIFGNCEIVRKVNLTETSWLEAMRNCLHAGGVPTSYNDLINNSNINTTVWTAEHTVLLDGDSGNSTDSIQQEHTECGYARLEFINYNANATNVSQLALIPFSLSDVLFSNCSEQRGYICIQGLAFLHNILRPNTIFVNGVTFWDARKMCTSKNMTQRRDTYTSIGELERGLNETANDTITDRTVWLNQTADVRVIKEAHQIDTGGINKYGAYTDMTGFTLTDYNISQNHASVCTFELRVNNSDNSDDSEDKNSTFPLNNREWPQHFWPITISSVAATVILVGSTLLCCYVKRRNKTMQPTNSKAVSIDNSVTTKPIYGAGDQPNVVDSDEAHNIEYELEREIKDPQTNQECLYDATYSFVVHADVNKLSENNVLDDSVYDNKDSINNINEQVTHNIYDRANFQNGESVYDLTD